MMLFDVKRFPRSPLSSCTWQRIVGHTPLSKNKVENDIIWNNKFVTIAGKAVFHRSNHCENKIIDIQNAEFK